MPKLLEHRVLLDKLKKFILEAEKEVEGYEELKAKKYDAFERTAGFIGLHVQDLKNGGFQGNTLRDFLNVPHPLPALVEANKNADRITLELGKAYVAFKSVIDSKFKPTVRDWHEALKDLREDAAKLEKAKSPDAKAFANLLGGYASFQHEHRYFFDKLVPNGPQKVDLADLKDQIENEVKKTRANREAQVLQQKLNMRALPKKFGEMRGLHEKLLQELAAIKAALQKGKHDDVAGLFKQVRPKKTSFDESVTEYEKAVAEFGKALDKDKEGKDIRKLVGDMVHFRQRIEREFDELWKLHVATSAAAKRKSAS